jgi:hypothetical protein
MPVIPALGDQKYHDQPGLQRETLHQKQQQQQNTHIMIPFANLYLLKRTPSHTAQYYTITTTQVHFLIPPLS